MASEPQDRMLSVMEDRGYTIDRAARRMRSRARNLVGLITPDIAYPFGVEGIQGVYGAIAESTLHPLVYTTDDVRKKRNAHTNLPIERWDERHAVAAACKTGTKITKRPTGC